MKVPDKDKALTIPAPPKKPWELSQEEVELVRNHVAKGATNEELAFCLGVARRYKLDPFRGQIWFVKRRDKNLDHYDRQLKKNIRGYKWVPIVGINGLLHIAARDHKKYFGSNDEPEYGPLLDVEWQSYDEETQKYKPQKPFKAPEWARVKVYKRGVEQPTTGTVYWAEIYPNVDNSPMVRQMPRLMLGKCALAQAIRRAYPATDGLYIQEEFMVEQAEPSENGKKSLEHAQEADKRLEHFKELNGGKVPTEEQAGLLEQGKTPEEILLQESIVEEEIWPKGPVHSTERQ